MEERYQMAIEANFRITNPGVFWSLQTIEQLGKYSMSEPRIEEIDDVFLDTKKRKLLAAGYCCRRRKQAKGFLITLTRLESAKGKSKKKEKWHVQLMKNQNGPADWPKSVARARVLKIISDKKLLSFFTLHLTRITRQISKKDQVIALVILDNVSMIQGGKDQLFKTLKIRMLIPEGEDHLQAIKSSLRELGSLKPETLTKFERAIAISKNEKK